MIELNKIYNEPCLETLRKMPNDFLDCVISSPPYWNLRDYGYPGQWGLEPTFNEYLENLWLLMDEIFRVLKPSGTVWINLGDTYGGNNSMASNNGRAGFGNEREQIVNRGISKCLMLIPHRFAIGCIERGWIMRNDIVWAKSNGMPESVTDRFTKKHEYFFFMVKSEKYYFDLDSIRDKVSQSSIERYRYEWNGNEDRSFPDAKQNNMKKRFANVEAKNQSIEKGKNPGDVSDFWDIPTKPNRESHYAQYSDDLIKKPILAGCPEGGIIYDPFMGSGSTAEAAIRANRNFIGSEMSTNYIEICNQRLKPYLQQTKLF
jgi:DNA modification methylase